MTSKQKVKCFVLVIPQLLLLWSSDCKINGSNMLFPSPLPSSATLHVFDGGAAETVVVASIAHTRTHR